MTEPTRTLLSRLLLRPDGSTRALTPLLMFRRDGLPRAPLRRTLFKKSGAPRPSLPADVRAAINKARLQFWLDNVDSPSGTERAVMEANRRDLLFIVEGEGDMTADLQRLAGAVRDLLGVGSVRVALWPGISRPASGQPGITLVPLDPKAPPARAIVLMGGSLPSPQGAWRLDKALDGHLIAHGDEAEAGLGAHWFKPPAWSPLLAAQGWLLDGAVAVDFRDPRTAEVWNRAHEVGWRAALAGLSAQLSPAEVAHVAHLCALRPTLDRAPLPLALPPLPQPLPKVAVIIPTRDGWHLLGPCLDSLRKTDWPRERLQIIVVDNGSQAKDCQEGLAAARAEGLISVLRSDEPFNFSRLNNLAVRSCDAELLVFLNNDTEARRADWLRRLACFALEEDVGAVGAKLVYGDGTIQHGGVVLGMEGGAVNAFVDLPESDGGYVGLGNLTRDISAVTGACICVRRSAFERVGGFDETLPVAYNDIAFCLALMQAGYRNICLGEAIFTHFEGKTRGRDTTPEKAQRLAHERARATSLYPDLFRQDPFYSPRLSRLTLYALPASPRDPAFEGAA